jgi:putative SOS response-associated peptidase YedK
MCGRFVSTTPPDQLAAYFGAAGVGERLTEPAYNVAPTNAVETVVTLGEERRLELFRWGLVPFWAKDPAIGNKMINARAETVATKNAYRRSFKKKRCIIPVDGFYEWKKIEGRKNKQPFFIHRPDGEPYAFAGLWDEWTDPEDSDRVLRSCTIITGEPNERMAELHHRMPVILPPGAWDAWLDPGNSDEAALTELLVPAPSELIVFEPVSTEVNNPRNRGSRLIEPVEIVLDEQGELL